MNEKISKTDSASEEEEQAHPAKSEFFNAFTEVVENISESDLLPIWQLVEKDHLITNKGILMKELKNQLRELILRDFGRMWSCTDVDFNLQVLDVMKKESIKLKDKPVFKLRSTGKTVEERLLPCRIKSLIKKISFLEKESENLNKLLETTMENITINRQRFADIDDERNFVNEEIDKRIERFDKTDEKIINLDFKINSLIDENLNKLK